MIGAVRRLIDSDGASVAPTVALSLFALVAVGGIAFDYARLAAMDTELQNAADQAALAAASQLDGEPGACARASAAAVGLVANSSLFANDGSGLAITLPDEPTCNAQDSIRFYQDKAATIEAITDAEARFVEVTVDSRRANYALTSVVGALTSGDISATARAGMGTALCKIPPLMVCNPYGDGVEVDWDAMRGRGLRAAAVSGSAWTPGGFGYLGPNDTPSTQEGLAFQNPAFSCQSIDTGEVNTGNPTPAVTALNTRFDIHDYGSGSNPLSQCVDDVCPAALNVTKDLVRDPTASGANACKIHSQGWHTPAAGTRFRPVPTAGTDPMRQFQDPAQPAIAAMGLPRDNLHYTSYNSSCPTGDKFGDGVWARGDYFNKYHSGRIPANASTMTRYETYLWEIANGYIPNVYVSGTSGDKQQGVPICRMDPPDPSRDRRVLTVAIGANCSELSGASTAVDIGDWVDMFFVEPGAPNGARGNSCDTGHEVYLEVIGRTTSGGNNAQVIRRDVPYLVR